jgi:CheY-like chemotaxis protein
MMPVMDGYQFLDEQRADPKLASIPVAIITATNGVDHQRIGAGTPIVKKPLKLSDLISVIRRLQSPA